MELEGQEFMSLPEVLAYFTRRGAPKFDANTQGEEMMESLARSINVTE